MKTISNYVCDFCGKSFDNEKDALNCEEKHREEKKSADMAAAKEKELEKLFNEYVIAYRKLPSIEFCDEAKHAIDSAFNDMVQNLIDLL